MTRGREFKLGAVVKGIIQLNAIEIQQFNSHRTRHNEKSHSIIALNMDLFF